MPLDIIMGRQDLVKLPTVSQSMRTRKDKVKTSLVWVLGVLLLIMSGVAYRVMASRLRLVADRPVPLPVSLSAFPLQVGNWLGRDVPIPDNIQRVAGNDDFLNRLYINSSSNQWINLYIAYSARPKTMLGHRPEICYVGGGWVHDSTKSSTVISPSGTQIQCLIHHFHMRPPQYEERIVLNFYILNGQITADESVFSGVGWRTPNIDGDPARYVAQVQISSITENSIITAAENMTDLILDYFPDENGEVRATEFTSIRSSVLR